MTTGLLFDLINPAPAHRHRHVPDTSKAAHVAAIQRGDIGKRGAEVLQWLLEWTDAHHDAPTSAEVAKFHHRHYSDRSYEWVVLYVRRALNDLLSDGFVCKGDDRDCTIAGMKANTWKVVTR